ncbi:MAG: hypothetical protein ACTSXJ_04015 [Candidatus Baldrarchaeia archaeon]
MSREDAWANAAKWMGWGLGLPIMVFVGAYIGHVIGSQYGKMYEAIGIIVGALLGFFVGVYDILMTAKIIERKKKGRTHRSKSNTQ